MDFSVINTIHKVSISNYYCFVATKCSGIFFLIFIIIGLIIIYLYLLYLVKFVLNIRLI